MRRLHLLRHAHAAPPGKYRDHERPLTTAGRAAAAQVGRALTARGDLIDIALCSDAARARETLDLVLETSGATPELRLERGIYQADCEEIAALLRVLPDEVRTVLVVGHNPGVGEFAAAFAGGGSTPDLDRLNRFFPPAALASFEIAAPWNELSWKGGQLLAFLS
ncbi:phosphohistidine phosphatase [Rhodoblastus acidophilus]|uniref:SixA phosphatase family protein n=1 Tax=Rhodoblastus acidophilus TaxID=1074 RepID=UPI0016080F7D|nr:histidine phosphatase family protein [Rhodoblastus acidophilus]MCW2284983.1 phosphohistidine phosphatase [Rhodoblastus acidophilus]MCW2333953.1 phosphohistidine phosphatase [Rhodoblastus acidophilus]